MGYAYLLLYLPKTQCILRPLCLKQPLQFYPEVTKLRTIITPKSFYSRSAKFDIDAVEAL
jgi:hypothetical protein